MPVSTKAFDADARGWRRDCVGAVRGIVFAPSGDTSDLREFKREAHLFSEIHGLTLSILDFTGAMWKRRRRVLDALHGAGDGLEVVAFFCHGWRRGIQAGYSTATVKELARAFTMCCLPNVIVPLYCCSAARGGAGGDGGFADMLRDASGATVFAHTTAGHCSRNPNVRRFKVPPGVGGQWVVAPGSAGWHQWRKDLKGAMRFRYPFQP